MLFCHRPNFNVLHIHVFDRYGENQVRHYERGLRPDEWKKGGKRDPNEGRALPDIPHSTPRREVRQPEAPVYREEETRQFRARPLGRLDNNMDLNSSIASSRRSQPLRADFFISVPIFNETLDHR